MAQAQALEIGSQAVLKRAELDALVGALARRGYRILGPTVRDQAIVYDEIRSAGELPIGWTDEQDGGRYRLKRRADAAVFGFSVAPQSWRRFLHLPRALLWRARKEGSEVRIEDASAEESPASQKMAFLGVRSCEIHAIEVQDRVFVKGKHQDRSYAARRENIFVVAVQCGEAGGTCFCVSMQTGPKATFGFDLALTEVLEGDRHEFLLEVGSAAGAELAAELVHRPAEQTDLDRAQSVIDRAAAQMGRVMDTTDIKGLLYRNMEHPRWKDVAERCLSCGNCTLVCPTCFCSTTDHEVDLTGTRTEAWRRWDSCFTADHSYIHGGSVRVSTLSRYRQWMTHKLATWIDQFGKSGCVGCGRCITWCPVGIDITEEVREIRRTSHAKDA